MGNSKRTIILVVLLLCHIPIAVIYDATVGVELSHGMTNGIHYGFIALPFIRLLPWGLLLSVFLLGFAVRSTVESCLKWLGLLALNIATFVFVLGILGRGLSAELSGLSTTVNQLNISSQVFYAVKKFDGESGANCYLLACEGTFGPCQVLGRINGPFPVTMQYLEQQRVIILQNAAEERREFRIEP